MKGTGIHYQADVRGRHGSRHIPREHNKIILISTLGKTTEAAATVNIGMDATVGVKQQLLQ